MCEAPSAQLRPPAPPSPPDRSPFRPPIRRRVWSPAGLLAALLLVGPAPTPAQTQPPPLPTLRYGVTADLPPLAFVADGVLRGLEIDLAQALAADLGLELALLDLPQRRLVEALRGGRIDLMLGGLADDEVRALGLAASAPVLRTGQMALIRGIDLPRFARELDVLLVDGPVGYEVASNGARFVHEHLPRAVRVPFPSAAAGIAALRQDQLALFIHDAPTIWAVASAPGERDLVGLFRPLTEERLAWLVRGSDEPLRARIDAVLAAWTRDGRLAALINRWIPVQVQVGR